MKFILIFFLFFYSYSSKGSENKIIFKINDKPFTSFDYEMRVRYLEFVGSNANLNKNVIINDFISANIFFEYYIKSNNKENLDKKINEIFDNINNTNENNNKKLSYEIDKQSILLNIKLDYVRKIILEKILNSNINNLNISKDEIDLLYNFKIKYLNFEIENISNIKKEIEKLDIKNFHNIKLILESKKIDFFFKEEDINNINEVEKKIKQNILSNNNFFILSKLNKHSIIFFEKSFETFNGIIVNIKSVRSKNFIGAENLLCDNLSKNKESFEIVSKEYKLIDLNNELKRKLVNINDYVKFSSNDENVYVVMCDIKFDKEVLNNINFNKLINKNVTEIEKKFISKYSKLYNLILINV